MNDYGASQHLPGPVTKSTLTRRLARWVLSSFLVTFMTTRIIVYLIMTRRIPDLYLYLGGTHVHHLNYGIFLLAGVGALLLFRPVAGRSLIRMGVVYGIGLALTFDEFGMWLHLGGSYWQRASWDAVAVIAGLLALIAVAPTIRQLRARQSWTALVLLVMFVTFSVLLVDSLRRVQRRVEPTLLELEESAPR